MTAIDISPAALAVAGAMPSGMASPTASRSSKANLLCDRAGRAAIRLHRQQSAVRLDGRNGAAATATSATTNRTSPCDAGDNGTDVIAPLIEQAASRLKPGGVLLIEISPMIAGEVEQLVRQQPALELGPTSAIWPVTPASFRRLAKAE